MNLTHLILRLLLGRRLPITKGELSVRGPSAAIAIRRDKYGVPHIDAASDADALYALGFCQGQDRSGQLEFLLRIARGQLSEWVGPVALPVDRICRRIGFRRAAEQQFPVLDEYVRRHMEAFAAGVTAGSTAGLSAKPHEFAILGGTPTPWDAIDIPAVLKFQSFILPSNWDVELARLRILLADGPDAVAALDPSGEFGTGNAKRGTEENTVPPSALPAPSLIQDLSTLQNFLGRGGGSNNWVIAGNRTVSGKPLLASDPHLAPNAPPPWYLAHLRTPEWQAAGACMVGLPGFAIGHNGFAAWGVTAGLTDNTDLFLETLGPDGQSVREADGSFTPCAVVRETIHVRGQPDVVEDVLVTSRGPLILPSTSDFPVSVSIRAVWLDPLPIEGFLGVLRARSFEEFRAPFARWPLLPLNIAYADVSGAIGWFLVGQLPLRTGGNSLLPRPAILPDSGWTGLIPFDEMPCVLNPEEGYWTTANNDPALAVAAALERRDEKGPDSRTENQIVRGSPHWLGADFCDPYRVRAIRDALAARTVDRR